MNFVLEFMSTKEKINIIPLDSRYLAAIRWCAS